MPISHGHHPYKYNDFVAPMEADDLIKAVDLKQNLYNQGTAAIEAKMQELAGFDIAREQDRVYANQELKKIYETVQNNSSKDFSNPQVVRSFLDLTKPLERDSIFTNAIQSTAELRNRQKTMADVKAKHPDQYHQANESDYMDDLEDWMNDPNAGATLGHREYTPWKDVSKQVMDITSKIKEEVTSENKKKGNYLSDIEVKKVTADRIKSVLSTLDPSLKRQIEIDANYQAKNTDDQTKWETIKSNVQQVYDFNNQMANIPNIENAEGNDEHLTAADFRRRAQAAKEQLGKIQGDRKLLNQSYANHYVNNWEDNMVNIYAYRQETEKLTEDPFALVNAHLQSSMKLAAQNHILDWENKQREMLLTGQAMKDSDGNIVNNPNYKPAKEKALTKAEQAAEDAKNFIFSRETTTGGTVKPNPLNDKLEDDIANGTLAEPIQKSASDIDEVFKLDLESAMKYVVGEDAWSSDYNNDYEVRFEPLIEGDNKTTKVTLVDKDQPWSKQNISFTIGELLDYADRFKAGETGSDAIKTNSK